MQLVLADLSPHGVWPVQDLVRDMVEADLALVDKGDLIS
jgi:hypothetical protein